MQEIFKIAVYMYEYASLRHVMYINITRVKGHGYIIINGHYYTLPLDPTHSISLILNKYHYATFDPDDISVHNESLPHSPTLQSLLYRYMHAS